MLESSVKSGVRMPPATVTLLVMYLMRSEDVRRAALGRIETKDFFSQEERDYRLVWDIIQNLCKLGFSDKINRDFMVAEVYNRTAGHPEYSISDNIQAALNFVSSTYAADFDFDASYGKMLLQQFLDERQVLDPLRRGLYADNSLPLDELLSKFVASHIRTRVQTAKILSPMTPGQEMFGTFSRKPTGIGFLDEMLGGGMMPGAVYGLLGPSSGGKTTLGIQLLATYAMTKRHALLASYESAVEGEVWGRICSAVTGLNVKNFEGKKDFNDLPPEVQTKLRACQHTSQDYLHVVDNNLKTNSGRPFGYGGADELITIVRELAHQGKTPELLIIDWFWPMMQRYVASKGKDEAQARSYVTGVMDKFCQLGLEFGTNVWINHQIDATNTKRKSGSTIHFTAAAEAKNLAWLMSACFALSAIDPKQTRPYPAVTLTVSKSRSQRASYKFVELHGELCQFRDVSDQVTIEERTNEIVDKEMENAVPDRNGMYVARDPEVTEEPKTTSLEDTYVANDSAKS